MKGLATLNSPVNFFFCGQLGLFVRIALRCLSITCTYWELLICLLFFQSTVQLLPVYKRSALSWCLEKRRERAWLCSRYTMTGLCRNSWDWRIGPKDSVAHREAKEVRCQKVWKLRYVVRRASATVTGKVWKQGGRFCFGRKQMMLHDQYGSRTDTAGFHQDCIFLRMATRSCLQTQPNQKGKQNPHDIQPAWQKMGPAHLLWDTGVQSPH